MRTARVLTLASAGLLIALGVPVAQGAMSRPAAPPDPPAALARYYDQRPAWHRCGSGEEYPASYRCATVTVPLDYARPTGPTLRLKISRLNTSAPGKRHGVLLTNSGGPGHRGLDDPLSMKETLTKKVRERYDLIGLDPRGLGASSPLRCGLTEGEASSDERPYRAATFAEDTARARRIAAKCVAREGARLPYINTRNTARDLDVVRGVLGERKISYVGWSYGTQIGAVYTQLFPGRSDRMVLDSAVDPNRFGRHSDLVMAAGSEAAFRDWSRLTARRDGTYHLGDTPAEVRAAFWKQVARADRTPVLYNGSDVDHQGWALTGADIRAWLRVEFFNTPSDAARHLVELRRSAGTRPQPESAGGRADAATDNIVSLHWAVTCGDNSASWPRDPDRYRRDAVRDRVRYPLYGDFAANITPCAFWPRGAEAATRVDNRVGALVVQNQWDSQTPLSEGLAMRRALHGARLLKVDGGRGHAVYGFPGAPACVTAMVDTYLTEGRLPTRDTTCRA
ncbi:alpha/beta hydrolase [Streptomyces sp. NPDC056948]|uniref:alpha/beta hydrolase n=1 Tax=Streptomyces sp. NPDC056948 TaxID=3345975 RepID=UPI00362880DF